MGSEARSQRRSTRRGSRTITSPKPFSDCTNTISQSQSQSLVPSKPKPKSKSCIQPKIHLNPSAADDESEPSTPPPRISSLSGGDVLEFHTVYNRKQTAYKRKQREKTSVVPFSSYSADRALNNGNMRNEYEDEGLWEAHTVPLLKKHRHAQPEQDASKNSLEDYIQQQRAYFHEVDAFELSEEEMGPGNESD